MDQLLSFAGLVEEWAPALEACGVVSLPDLLCVQPASLVVLGMSYSDAQRLLVVAYSVHAAGGTETYAEMLAVAQETETVALDLLEKTAAALLHEGLVGGFLEYACKHLASSQEPRAAVLALTAAERARASCQATETAKTLGAVARAISDALIWRVQLSSVYGSREAFLCQLELAYAQPLDDSTKSKLLLGHYKAVATRFPSAFLSQAKVDALRSGRGCRKAKAKKGATTMLAEVQTGDA